MKFDTLRREYRHGGLRRADLAADPMAQFETWMRQAVGGQLGDPTAMTLATVSPSGQPSQRIVLLKQADQSGFVFYTSYGSRKAEELCANPRVSLHFPWHGMDRQVKVCGEAFKISVADSWRYFATRPRGSQLAAHASPQSQVLKSRAALLAEFARVKAKHHGGEVPLPGGWGGYRVRPHEIEFWQGRADRLHDRFRYRRNEHGGWDIERLAP